MYLEMISAILAKSTISISSESPKKLHKKGLPHRCEQA